MGRLAVNAGSARFLSPRRTVVNVLHMTDEAAKSPTEALSVYDHIVMMVEQMAAVSWQKLGLQPDLLSGKIAPDLAEAKVAIDVTTLLAGLIENRFDEADRRRLQGLITDLRINYVQKTKEGER